MWTWVSPKKGRRKGEYRRSFRRFVGLAGDQPPPDHAAVSDFRRLLLERDIAVEIFSELRDQLDRFDRSTLAPAFDAARGGTGPRIPSAIATDIRLFRPPDWVTLEQCFLDYWNDKCRGRNVAMSTDAYLSDVPDGIAPHMVLVRRCPDDGGFRYEWVGEQVEAANQGSVVGSSLGEKSRRNVQEYGHPGIQGELERLFGAATAGNRPIGTATNLLNARGNRCRLWGPISSTWWQQTPPGRALQRLTKSLWGMSRWRTIRRRKNRWRTIRLSVPLARLLGEGSSSIET